VWPLGANSYGENVREVSNWRFRLQSMADVGLLEAVHSILVVFDAVSLLADAMVFSTIPLQPTALQALYGTRKKLSATQWHCYAVEHMLPSAYILGHPGMGATLQTFYRKKADGDNAYVPLLNMAETPEAWHVGQVTPLNPDDSSPFRIGNVQKGQTMTVLETGASISMAASHNASPQHFLLIRKPAGQLCLRRFTGSILVCSLQYRFVATLPFLTHLLQHCILFLCWGGHMW
jgi:hypothetical protein